MKEQQRTEQQISYPAGHGEARVDAGQCHEEGKAEGASPESGTARARRILIEPLQGLARRRGTSAATHADTLDRVARKLSYMTEPGLRGLVELCLGFAGLNGIANRVTPTCPPDGLILAWGYGLEATPVQRSDYPASVLRSAMGRRAYDAGMGVELPRACRRFGPPPTSYSLIALKEEAEANSRRRKVLREAAEAGERLNPSAEAELKAWHDDALVVEQLVAEGDERREARAAAEGEAA